MEASFKSTSSPAFLVPQYCLSYSSVLKLLFKLTKKTIIGEILMFAHQKSIKYTVCTQNTYESWDWLFGDGFVGSVAAFCCCMMHKKDVLLTTSNLLLGKHQEKAKKKLVYDFKRLIFVHTPMIYPNIHVAPCIL